MRLIVASRTTAGMTLCHVQVSSLSHSMNSICSKMAWYSTSVSLSVLRQTEASSIFFCSTQKQAISKLREFPKLVFISLGTEFSSIFRVFGFFFTHKLVSVLVSTGSSAFGSTTTCSSFSLFSKRFWCPTLL